MPPRMLWCAVSQTYQIQVIQLRRESSMGTKNGSFDYGRCEKIRCEMLEKCISQCANMYSCKMCILLSRTFEFYFVSKFLMNYLDYACKYSTFHMIISRPENYIFFLNILETFSGEGIFRYISFVCSWLFTEIDLEKKNFLKSLLFCSSIQLSGTQCAKIRKKVQFKEAATFLNYIIKY